MKTLFTIGALNGKADSLLMVFGSDHCCYGLLDSAGNRFTGIRYMAMENPADSENLAAILEGLDGDPGKVVVCSAYAQAMLVPQQYFKEDFPLLKALEDLPSRAYLSDSIDEWQMKTAYSMPSNLYGRLRERFPSARFFHSYTPAVRLYNGFVAEDQVDIHFSVRQFRVLVRRKNAVQLIQTYDYKTPLDVVYFLLKICEELKLDQSELFLILSGLIDSDSALYKELHHYFLNLQFAPAPSFSLPSHEHPHYYFTSLYNLATCAS